MQRDVLDLFEVQAGDELPLEQLRVERRVVRERGRALAQACRLGRLEVLRLVADRDPLGGGAPRRRFDAREHPNEGRLSGRIRSDDPHDLALRERPRTHREMELGILLLEGREPHKRVRPGGRLRRVGDEPDGLGAEPNVLVLEVAGKVGVDRRAHREGMADDAERRGLSVDQVGLVGEVVQECEVVLDDEDALRLSRASQDPRDLEAVHDIEVARRLVDQVEVDVGSDRPSDRHELELASRQLRQAAVGPVREPDLVECLSSPGPAART